ncbi:triadin [Grus japonensis]|uniref:Triadin n=1 Tax=Grus japonensis TaxID=30415 RepID=A0ABC9WU04_GRUJA
MFMSKWRPVMSDVPQESVLGLTLFNIFVSNMDSGIECTLSKFANDAKRCGAVDKLEGRDAIQRDLYRLERWAHVNCMKVNKAKCKVLHVSWGNPKHNYRLGEEWIESSPEEKNRLRKVILHLYSTLMRPHLDYCIQLWASNIRRTRSCWSESRGGP